MIRPIPIALVTTSLLFACRPDTADQFRSRGFNIAKNNATPTVTKTTDTKNNDQNGDLGSLRGGQTPIPPQTPVATPPPNPPDINLNARTATPAPTPYVPPTPEPDCTNMQLSRDSVTLDRAGTPSEEIKISGYPSGCAEGYTCFSPGHVSIRILNQFGNEIEKQWDSTAQNYFFTINDWLKVEAPKLGFCAMNGSIRLRANANAASARSITLIIEGLHSLNGPFRKYLSVTQN